MSQRMRYTVVLGPDADGFGYTVRVPALPGCVTEGRTREEALSNAREAIEGYIEGSQKAGEPVPCDSAPPEIATVTIA